MPIDPLAKLASQAKRTDYLHKRAVKRKHKRGTLSKAETSAVLLVAENHPTPKQVESLAVALNRSEDTIKSVIVKAREKFQRQADYYVDILAKSADKGLTSNQPDVARKAAQWAIEHMQARDSEGNVERIVEKDVSSNEGAKVQIGIVLGGLPARPTLPSPIDVSKDE